LKAGAYFPLKGEQMPPTGVHEAFLGDGFPAVQFGAQALSPGLLLGHLFDQGQIGKAGGQPGREDQPAKLFPARLFLGAQSGGRFCGKLRKPDACLVVLYAPHGGVPRNLV